MKYPEFIIPGVYKGGTSALWYNLDKHPKIHMAMKKESIEIHFWASRFKHRGHDWYKSFFKDGYICGEKSPGYYMSKGSMRQIYKHIPNCKIILALRNPVDRAYSHFQMHSKSSGRKEHNLKFNMPLFKQRYANSGRYWVHIEKNILPLFDKDQIYICVMEHMKKDMTNKMKDLFEFIGVDDLGFKPKIVEGAFRKNRNRKEDVELNRSQDFYRVWSRHKDRLTGPFRKELLDHYKGLNKKLFDFLGYEIEEWKK